MRIYVAGPYCPKTDDVHDAARLAQANVKAAIKVGIALIKKGHTPFIPHLTHFVHLENEENFPAEVWYRLDFDFLEVCEGFYYMSSSRGADAELQEARRLGMPVFFSLQEVPDAQS